MSPFRYIWERYFVWELMKTFVLFLVTFYGLYILIDYANHTISFHHNHIRPTWTQLGIYYISEFTRRMDILIPFALLISTVRTLCQLNVHNEFVALLASGISMKRLMLPFILVGLFFSVLIFANNQFLLPRGLNAIKKIDASYSEQKQLKEKQFLTKHFILEDGTTVLYLDYNDVLHRFKDVYWIKNIDLIYRMEELDVSAESPLAKNVDIITRDQAGNMVVTETNPEQSFPEIRFNKRKLHDTMTAPDELPLTTLWKKIPEASSINSEKESQLITALYMKLALPWLCIFAVIGPAPLCLVFTRSLHVFFIYAISIFGLVGCYLILDAAAVLGKRQVMWPAIAIWLPLTLFAAILGWRFWRHGTL